MFKRTSSKGFLFLLLLLTFSSFCSKGPLDDLTGTWRFVLHGTGGELPFHADISEDDSGHLNAVVRNGDERLPFSSVEIKGDSIFFDFEHYDSILRGTR